ncbi:MAG: ABC transporter ATP-binding protein [Pseudoxanthomonas sp.]|nr:ABC transporter ATP-binding protein [Pseudoxanthomonas sp.]
MSMLALDSVSVGYPAQGGSRIAVDALDLALEAGQVGCLLGASGCGKTTVLRAVAGFEPLRAGSISIDGVLVASPSLQLPPEQRRVGMMFQDYALFPHLSVEANVGFGLARLPRRQIQARVAEMLALVGLAERAGAFPHELSGGQQQRVALARALAPRPALLLLDEPFSNLDIHTRQLLASELRGVLKASRTTALLVTHDQTEAFAMADRIAVMDQGRILQCGSGSELYARPADRFVAGFIGRGAVLDGALLGLTPGEDVLVRPEHLRLDPGGGVQVRLVERSIRGPGQTAVVALPCGQRLQADLPLEHQAAPGATLHFALVSEALARYRR